MRGSRNSGAARTELRCRLYNKAVTPCSALKGRAALGNPAGRFERQQRERVHDGWYEEDTDAPRAVQEVLPEQARTIIARNSSPDVPFSQSVNPYRGCEHGCIYCYARPSHAYIDLSPGLDFERRLRFKANAAEVLERELCSPRYVCEPITLGANTDPYQPVEAGLGITQRLLEVCERHAQPVSIITKSALVLRDTDILGAGRTGDPDDQRRRTRGDTRRERRGRRAQGRLDPAAPAVGGARAVPRVAAMPLPRASGACDEPDPPEPRGARERLAFWLANARFGPLRRLDRTALQAGRAAFWLE